MPIEIKELVIRATIDPKGMESQGGQKSGTSTNERLVAECVEQVLDILQRQQER